MFHPRILVNLCFLCFGCPLVDAQSNNQPSEAGIEFARVDDRPLLLDFYQARSNDGKAPLVIWVHGGAWRAGSRADVPVQALTEHGFAIASVDYRLSGEEMFPAQVHDIKAAIRFLRSQAARFHVDADRLIVAGASAGGHLAALVGVSNGVADLEGAVGDHRNVSSEVQAIVSFYGASNLQTILSQSTPHGLSVRVSALQLLLGGQPDQVAELAKLASPVAHVDAGDPPLLLIHGDQDPQMPVNQALELLGVYQSVQAKVKLHIVHGGAHGGAGFYEPKMLALVRDFLGAE